jgi:hypothetical protein
MRSPLHVRRARLGRIQSLIRFMREIGQAHGAKSPAQAALNRLIAKGTIPIPGAKNARQAQENAAALVDLPAHARGALIVDLHAVAAHVAAAGPKGWDRDVRARALVLGRRAGGAARDVRAIRWDPRELGRILVYADRGFLCEAKNVELLGFHATLEQLQRYKRMQQVQREVVMAYLALMHMPASDASLLELATKPLEGPAFSRKRQKGQVEALAAQSPVSFSLPRTSATKPIFTSRAAEEAWEREHGLSERSGGVR